MKKILLTLIFIFTLSVFNTERSYAICFLFDGTYIGAVNFKGNHFPLFIVVANQHITGFFAPEDQKTHGPTGSSFNLGDLTASSTYTLSLTTDNNILIKSADGKVNGKAKPITIKEGSSSYTGFYNADSINDFLPGDFLNIGSDGGAILKFAIPGDKVVHAFGKINNSGEFVQVFPGKGKGPHVTISFDGDSVDLEETLNDDDFTTSLDKFVSASCNSTSSSSTSSSGSTSNKPALVSNFQGALNGILSITTNKSFTGGESEIKALQNEVRLVKYTLLNLPASDCNSTLAEQVQNVSIAIDAVRDIATCGSSCAAVLLSIDEDNLIIQGQSTIDESGNGVVDICEQYSQFSGEKPLSIVPGFKDSINNLYNLFKLIRKEARKVFGKEDDSELLFNKFEKSIKVIRSSLGLPANICNLHIEQASTDFRENAVSISDKVCQGVGRPECSTSAILSSKLIDLIHDADDVETFIKLDGNKNGIIDVCE